ncbi:DUF262 domain-containing protein [Paraburkholderia sp. RL17-347-BIC-D]|uniref:DUF262 domain-containing protein n=1 Tax=Paraburkholderia sp. RL17-347-BIC-D TaxID=3031632 RepID=UPI0038B7F3C5
MPSFQRPYKWSVKNIHDLFADIDANLGKPAYRLGSIVFHSKIEKNDDGDGTAEWLDIVDGQQRTLTLILAVRAIIKTGSGKPQRDDLKRTLATLNKAIEAFINRQRFASQISERNLLRVHRELVRRVERPSFTEALIDFLLNRCQVVTFVLKDVSEAFQFFDS